MQYWEALQKGKNILAKGRIESSALCSRVLLRHAAGISETQLILSRNHFLPQEIEEKYFDFIARRFAGEPLAYITREKEFFGRPFQVSPAVLIPRPETEQIIEIALESPLPKNTLFLDACCGSGCIGLTLLLEKSEFQGFFVDISLDALKICKLNMEKYGINQPLFSGSIFSNFFQHDCFDLVVANPPYISPTEIDTVMDDVLEFEPSMALFSESNGLAHIFQIIRLGQQILKHNGLLIMEHGSTQGRAIRRFMENSGYGYVKDNRDLAGKERIITGKKK